MENLRANAAAISHHLRRAQVLLSHLRVPGSSLELSLFSPPASCCVVLPLRQVLLSELSFVRTGIDRILSHEERAVAAATGSTVS